MWPRGGLWRDGAFLRLWAGQAISELGSRVTVLALPLGAILVLHASAFQVALLRTFEVAPLLLFALPAGVWIDRVRRRPLMIAADVGSALALASIPLAYWTGTLSLAEVYAVAFVVGALAVVFDVAYLSFLPSLLPPERLADGNAKLQATRSATESAGPAVAGVLVGLFTAPVAILADAVSFAASALLVGSIRRPEERVEVERRRLGTELAEGVRYVFAQPYLRTLTTWSAGWSFFNSGFLALMVVYLVRGLGLSATTVGWILGLGSLGGVLGALVSARVVARFGIGPTIAVSGVLSSLGIFGLPLARQSTRFGLLDAEWAVPVSLVCCVGALLLARGAKSELERSLERSGGHRRVRASRWLAVAGISIALAAAIAVGFYHLLLHLEG